VTSHTLENGRDDRRHPSPINSNTLLYHLTRRYMYMCCVSTFHPTSDRPSEVHHISAAPTSLLPRARQRSPSPAPSRARRHARRVPCSSTQAPYVLDSPCVPLLTSVCGRCVASVGVATVYGVRWLCARVCTRATLRTRATSAAPLCAFWQGRRRRRQPCGGRSASALRHV